MLRICEILKRILITLKPSISTNNYFNYMATVLLNKVVDNLQNLFNKITNLPKRLCNKVSKIDTTTIIQNIMVQLKNGPKKKFSYWRYDYGAM